MATRIDRALVADTALRLLNDVGLEGLTLRRIAKELNVQAPALYWHFKNKQELLDEMATEMFRRMAPDMAAVADTAGISWQEYMRRTAHVVRRGMLGYRDGAKVFSGTRFTDTSYGGVVEDMLRVCVAAGFTARGAARGWFTVNTYTMGYVIEEQSVYPVPGSGTPPTTGRCGNCAWAAPRSPPGRGTSSSATSTPASRTGCAPSSPASRPRCYRVRTAVSDRRSRGVRRRST
ncbi:TetR family transcriptional regulator [Streptomyces stramineus]